MFRGRVNIVAVPAGRWTRIKQAASRRQLMKKRKEWKSSVVHSIPDFPEEKASHQYKKRSRAKRSRSRLITIHHPATSIWFIYLHSSVHGPSIHPFTCTSILRFFWSLFTFWTYTWTNKDRTFFWFFYLHGIIPSPRVPHPIIIPFFYCILPLIFENTTTTVPVKSIPIPCQILVQSHPTTKQFRQV